MPTADHAEGIGGGEIRRAAQLGNGLLASIDKIGINLVIIRKRPHAEHAVLRLQRHVDILGNVVGDERRNADAEIDVNPSSSSCAARRAMSLRSQGIGYYAVSRSRTVRCSMRFSWSP